jgi:non-heme chloroperoxidase
MTAAPDPHEGAPRRFTGIANLVGVLRNLGFVGTGSPNSGNLLRYTVDDGQAIPVCITGQGTPVVLVHGLGCSHRHWMPVARRLARRHRVFAWDARGHGQCTALPGARITLDRLARDLHLLLEHFELERVALVGHSMGALTVLRYLHERGTTRVRAVGLVDQSPRIVTDETWRLGLFGGCSAAMLGGLINGARADLAETVLRQVQAMAGEWLRPSLAPNAPLGRALRRWLQRINAAPLLDLAESLAAADFRPVITQLQVPLLVVLGERSPHYAGVPLDAYYRQAAPHAKVAIYPRAGHSPHFTEPARFAADLARLLAESA